MWEPTCPSRGLKMTTTAYSAWKSTAATVVIPKGRQHLSAVLVMFTYALPGKGNVFDCGTHRQTATNELYTTL